MPCKLITLHIEVCGLRNTDHIVNAHRINNINMFWDLVNPFQDLIFINVICPASFYDPVFRAKSWEPSTNVLYYTCGLVGQVEDSTPGDYFFTHLPVQREHGSQPSLTTRDRELVKYFAEDLPKRQHHAHLGVPTSLLGQNKHNVIIYVIGTVADDDSI